MKKLTLILVAMTMSLFSFAAQPKRIYAYGLSSTLVDKVYTFSFTANETPTSGKIIFYDATSSELVGEIALTNPVLGKNEIEIAEYSLPGNDGQQLNWAIELSAAAVTAYEKVFADASHQYRRGFSNVDISPESDYFGTVYVADWCKTKTNSQIYVYSPVYSKSATGYNPGSPEEGWGCSRFTIAPNGDLWLSDFSDGHSGLFLVDPADLTKATQFFEGTRASSGLIKNGDVEVGSSLSCATLYGTGANTKLVTVAEDYTGKSYPVAVFNVGQEDGSLSTTWTTAPNILFNTSGNGAASFDVKACKKGVWVTSNRSTGNNTNLYTSMRFYTWDGICTWSSHEHTDVINGNLGAGIAITPDESQIIMKIHDNTIAIFDLTWDATKEDATPILTLNASFDSGYAAVSSINLDYAGNIVTVAGTNFGNTDTQRMRLAVYSNPTNNNTCEVPAKKADVVTKVEAAVALYTVTTNVNDPAMGSVSGNLGTYEDGASAELTAVANEHYEFDNWTGDVSSTENPLTITVDGDKTITANFAKKQYTLTVLANDAVKGDVNGSGTYEYGTEVVITATPKSGYEFTGWSNGSKENPLTISMEEDTELTANFRAVLASSITLNAHPVKDYSASIVGTMKRAIQNGENTIVLTHEDDGTPHIYNIAHATKTVTEISQEGVVAVDPDNAGDFLAISDIALTADGKLVAINKIVCQSDEGQVVEGYKRGETRVYKWDNIDGAPSVWFTSKQSSNWYKSIQGHTMAYKGTSTTGTLFTTGVTATGEKFRYSVYNVIDGVYDGEANNNNTYFHFTKGSAQTITALGENYELNASPLATTNWILDGGKVEPFEIIDPLTYNTEVIEGTKLANNTLGKKFNGATYLANYNDHHLMIAPYAGADGKLAGVKVLGISDGFDAATLVTTATDLTNPIDATSAAATTYVDGDGDLTIYLIADGKVYTFSEKVYTAQIFTVTANAGEGGTVEGGGPYEENTTATLTATPAEHYDFLNWTEGGEVVSTTAEYSFTVTKDIELTANFQEHAKYTITAVSNDENMGTVIGGGTYYKDTEVTLTATANSGYVFVDWNDGNTDETRTFTAGVDMPETLTANFKVAVPRAWAYDLKVVEDGDNYKFTFTATTAGTATLLFADKEGNALAPTSYDLGAINAGLNTATVAKSLFTEPKDIYWSVKMDGEAITRMAELTNDNNTDYHFWMPTGVAVDNNPESPYFGQFYIASPRSGKMTEGGGNGIQHNAGVYVFDQTLTLLNETKQQGYIPSNVSVSGSDHLQLHRIAVNPINSEVAFSQKTASIAAIWNMNPANMKAAAVNLINETSIADANSLCFDKNGVLYVADASTNSIYKVKDGVATTFATTPELVQNRNAIASDGRGGLWIAQYRGQDIAEDGYARLMYFNAEGTLDYKVDKDTPHGFTGTAQRGAVAYNSKENILAFGANRVATLYQVTYDLETGVPTLEELCKTPDIASNIDGLAFDYAGDLYVTSASVERLFKFVLPTNENSYTIPAPTSQVLKKETRYTVTVNVVGDGEVEGAGEYVAGATAELRAVPTINNEFVNWTLEDASTSTANPLTLTVNSNITITANFAKIKRNLTLRTNDEAKGTVSGAGSYDHGTDVEITATPKEGYKLLYWSDRSTENPRTITMTKNEAISAYFVKDYADEPTFTITKMWENTNVPASTNNGYQAVGWDGKIYMKDRLNASINVYTEIGSELYAQLGATVTGLAGDQPIAVDDAGNLVVRSGSTNFYDSPTQVSIFRKNENTPEVIDFTLPATGRCDFISASGNIYSAEGGYVYFYCQNQTTVSRLYIKNGGASAADISVDKLDNATLTAGSSQSHVFTNIFGDLMTHTRDNNYKVLQEVNVLTGAVSTMNLPNFKKSTLGGCSFELGGKEFIAYNIAGTDYNSEWNLYNMTDKVFVSNEALYAKNTTDKNSAANWLNVQVVDENTAYIYQFCPTLGVAVWKVTCTTEKTVTIDENAVNTTALEDYEGETVTATVTRNFGANKILTVTLPFDMSASQISTHFGNATVYEFYNVVDAGVELHLQFAHTNSIEAGKPYILQTTTSGYDAEDGFTIENVTINTELTQVKIGDLTMVPVLDNGGTLDQPTQYYLSNNALYCAGDYERPLPGLRAFFTSATSTPIRARVIFDDNGATSIPTVIAPETKAQKIIKDGRLIIIRGEHQYNAQGQMIE